MYYSYKVTFPTLPFVRSEMSAKLQVLIIKKLQNKLKIVMLKNFKSKWAAKAASAL